jgi:hypothetical protein
MPLIRITSAQEGWSVYVPLDPRLPYTDLDVAKKLKALGCTGQILPGGIVEVDADRSNVKNPVDSKAG